MNRWKRLAPVTAVVASAAMVLSACVGSDAAADRSELAFWMMGEGSEAPKKVQAARAGGEGSGVGLVPASSGWRSHRVHGKAAMAFAGRSRADSRHRLAGFSSQISWLVG